MKKVIATMILSISLFSIGFGQTMEKEYFNYLQGTERNTKKEFIVAPIPKNVKKDGNVVIVTFDRREWEMMQRNLNSLRMQMLYRSNLKVRNTKR